MVSRLALVALATATLFSSLALTGCAATADRPEQAPIAAAKQAVENNDNPNDRGPNGCTVGGDAKIWGCCGSEKTSDTPGCKMCHFACYLHDWACSDCSGSFCGTDCVPDMYSGSGGPVSDWMTSGMSVGNLGVVPTAALGTGFTAGIASPDHCKYSGAEGQYAEAVVATLDSGIGRADFLAALSVHGQSLVTPSGREAFAFVKGNTSAVVVMDGSKVLLVSGAGVSGAQLQAFSFTALEPVTF